MKECKECLKARKMNADYTPASFRGDTGRKGRLSNAELSTSLTIVSTCPGISVQTASGGKEHHHPQLIRCESFPAPACCSDAL